MNSMNSGCHMEEGQRDCVSGFFAQCARAPHGLFWDQPYFGCPQTTMAPIQIQWKHRRVDSFPLAFDLWVGGTRIPQDCAVIGLCRDFIVFFPGLSVHSDFEFDARALPKRFVTETVREKNVREAVWKTHLCYPRWLFSHDSSALVVGWRWGRFGDSVSPR